MREDFYSQSRHVVDATVWFCGVSAADAFPRCGHTVDLSDLGCIVPREACGGLPCAERDTWKRGNAVHIIINFLRLDFRCGHIKGDGGDIIDL